MTSTDTFLTLKNVSEGRYKEKGSKFIAYAYPVQNEEEVREKVDALKKQYHDARHHCYAYILGINQDQYRANDDGEPNHSAGDPILGQIRSNKLTHTLIVVVRYFGGTKLGVGGLIQAYKTAAAEAIANNEIIEDVLQLSFHVRFDYLAMNDIMRLIKEEDLEICHQDFDLHCEMKFKVRESLKESILQKLEKIEGLSVLAP